MGIVEQGRLLRTTCLECEAAERTVVSERQVRRGSPCLKCRLSGGRGVLVEDIERINSRTGKRWPFSTTDGVVNARIPYLPWMISHMIGAIARQLLQSLPSHAVTYLHALGDFVSEVEEAGSSRCAQSGSPRRNAAYCCGASASPSQAGRTARAAIRPRPSA